MNYFDFFSLPTQYEISLEQLEKKYILIQQSSHPDKLSNKSADEKYKALNHSIEANKAYTTLKAPLLRAKHLLSLNNINIDQEIRVNVSEKLLQQSFMDREKLEDTETPEELKTLLAKTKDDINTIELQLNNDFQKKEKRNAITGTINLQYKTKLLLEIKNKIKRIR